MAEITEKSIEFQMFKDYWSLVKFGFAGGRGVDNFFNKITDGVNAFYEKYKTKYAKDLGLALLNEVDRRERK